MSPRSKLLKALLNLEIFTDSFDVLSSIKVPPLKSIPKFNPLKSNNINESNIKIEDAILNQYVDAGVIIHENRFTY